MTVDIIALDLMAREIHRKLIKYDPAAQDIRIEHNEDACDEITGLATEVASVKGKLEVMTRLMWGIVLVLVGIFIQGLFS